MGDSAAAMRLMRRADPGDSSDPATDAATANHAIQLTETVN